MFSLICAVHLYVLVWDSLKYPDFHLYVLGWRAAQPADFFTYMCWFWRRSRKNQHIFKLLNGEAVAALKKQIFTYMTCAVHLYVLVWNHYAPFSLICAAHISENILYR